MADPVSFTIAMAVELAIAYLFPAEGPRLKDLKVSASTYGAAIPEVYGLVRVAANMIWSDKIREHKRKMMAGKGGFINTYKYTCSFAMGFCAGPITAVRRIWANSKLIYDRSGSSEVVMGGKYRMRVYKGDELQMPDGTLEELLGVDNTPAFRGLCYLVFDDCPLEDFGNQIPQIAVEVIAGCDITYSVAGPHLLASPDLTSSQDGQFLVDPERGLAYKYTVDFSKPFQSDGSAWLRRWNIDTGKEDYRRSGELSDISAILGASPLSGRLIVQHRIGNSVTFASLDPSSLAVMGTIGQNDASFTNPATLGAGAFATNIFFEEYVAYVSLFGDVCVFKTFPILDEYAKIDDIGGPGGGWFTCGLYDADDPTFYVWTGGTGTGAYTPELILKRYTRDVIGIPIGWSTHIEMTIPNPVADTGGVNIGFGVLGCHYDEGDGGILLFWSENERQWVGKWDIIAHAWKWKRDINGYGSPGDLHPVRPISGRIMWPGSFNGLYSMNTLTGEFEGEGRDRYYEYNDPMEVPLPFVAPPDKTYTPIATENYSIFHDSYYDPFRDALVVTDVNGTEGQVMHPVINPGPSTLAGFVERILRRAGLGVEHFDVSALESVPLKGFGWASGTDVKSILAQMRMIFLFDLVETNGKLVAVLRDDGSAPDSASVTVRTIPQKLLAGTAEDAFDFWQETRMQEAELPERISIAYMNLDDDFQTSEAISKRISNPIPSMFSRQQVAIETTIVMPAKQAKDQVNKMLWTQWSERTKHNTRLPWAYLALDPADLIGVKMNDGRTYVDRLHQLEFGADLAIASESYSRDAGAYDSDVINADGGGSGPADPVRMPTPAQAVILNTPMLRDQDDTAGGYSLYYTGVASASSGVFRGAALFRGKDTVNFNMLYGTDQDVEWGRVQAITPAPRHGDFALDWATQIIIWPGVDWFDLESTSDDLLWSGANLCTVGDEVLQFRDAVQNPNGSWTIWNLLRGRRGTEYACATHKAGELFAFLSADTIIGESETLDARGQRRYFVAVGSGREAIRETPTIIDYEPRDLMPYAPKDIRREITGSSVTVTWRRRTRMGGNMQDGTGSVPLHEAEERYEVYILANPFTGDGSRGNTVPLDAVIFQAETTTSEVTFDVSELAAPFDVNLDSLHVLVYQVSATVGRGFPGSRSIQPWRAF